MPGEVLSSTDMPRIDTDPFDREILRDPYPFHRRLRAAGPIVWLERYETYGVSRYEQVAAVFKDWQQFSSAGGAGLSDIRKPGAWRVPGPIVEVDPPRHTQVRSTMNRIISPKVIRGWKEDFQREAEIICDEVLSTNTLDVVPQLIEAYVLKVFPSALGIEVNRENLITVGNHNFNALGPKNDLFLRSQAQVEAISGWFEQSQKQESMIPGGFGELIFAAEKAGELPEGVASAMLRTLLRGGMDTTISGLGSTLRLLAENPDQWQLLKAEPARVRAAFEEAIRLESPAQTLYRTTSGEVEFAGFRLQADTKVQVFIAAANRDPDRWERPDSYDISRSVAGHVALGAGIHFCLGQMIARLEAECLLGSLVRRVTKLELNGEPRHRLINALRTLETLPLRITYS